MRSFELFDSRFFIFLAILAALRLGGGHAYAAAGQDQFPGYAVAIALAAGAVLTWAFGHGITPRRDDVRPNPSALALMLRGKSAFDSARRTESFSPSEQQRRWLHAASAGLGVGAVLSFLWAAAHDPVRVARFVDTVGPLGVACAVGVVLFAAILWAGWEVVFPAVEQIEPPEER